MRRISAGFTAIALRGARTIVLGALLASFGLLLAGCSGKSTSTAEHMKRAQSYLAKHDQRSAIIELKNVLQKNPKMAKARALLGRAYLQLGNGAAAAAELERARALGAKDPALVLDLARALFLQGKFQKADEELMHPPPGVPVAALLALRGDAKLGLGKPKEARALFTEALAKDKHDPDALRGLARLDIGKGDTGSATRQLNLALDASSEDLQTWLLKGQLELSLGKPKSAQASFQRALKLAPSNPGALVGMARALLAQREPKRAGRILKSLSAASPNNPLVNYLIAIKDEQEHDLNGAQTALREVLRVAPNHAPSQLMLGSLLYMRHNYQQAKELVSRFVGRFPDNLPARKLLAAIDLELGKPGEAISQVIPMLQKAPRDPQLLALLGTAYLAEKQVDKGRALLEKAASIAPNAAAIKTQLAVGLFASGSSEKAISELREVAGKNPGFERANLLLILAYLQRGEFDQALAQARTFATKRPKSPVPVNLMGVAYLGKKDEAGARKEFQKALELDPGFTTAAMNLARLDLKDHKVDAAKKQLDYVLKKVPSHPGAMILLAGIESNEGHAQKALALLREARDANPHALAPRLILGLYYLRHGDRERTLTMAQEATGIAPQNAQAQMLLARAQLLNGHPKAAEQTLAALASQQPKSAGVFYQMALAQLAANEVAAARKSLDQALALAPGNQRILFTQGELALRTGAPDTAASVVAELRKRHPDAAAGFLLAGDLDSARGERDKALVAYREAFRRAPTTGNQLRIVTTLVALGKSAAATTELSQWVTKHPDDAAARLALGTLHQRAGQNDQAAAQYRKVISEEPDNAVALNNLAWLYGLKKDPKAVSLAQKAFGLQPDQPAIADTYGWLLVRNGQAQQGITLLQKAHRLDGSNPNITYHLAVARAKTGDKAGARALLHALLSSGKPFPDADAARKLLKSL